MATVQNLKDLKGLWLTIHGKVYDLTQFKDHPGGYEILEEFKGKNASEEFIKAGHPDYVKEDMEKYCLGDIPKITQEEVAKHNKEGDSWMAIYGKVFDVSEFRSHPGGYEILVDNAGKDATKPFDDIDHSPGAKKDLEKYFIGDYVPGESPPVQPSSFNYLLLAPLVFIIIGYFINSILS